MASSTEKNTAVGRAAAQIRDNARNAWRAGRINLETFRVKVETVNEMKQRVRKIEAEASE